jgi:hypothetical protein
VSTLREQLTGERADRDARGGFAALARSRMLRMSSLPYFTTPARSACPGAGA